MEQLERVRNALSQLVGADIARRRLLERAALRLRYGSSHDDLPLLVGPRGSGRTTLLSTLARGLDVPLVQLDCRALSETEIRGLPRSAGGFEPSAVSRAVADKTPCVLVFNHLDQLAEGSSERERTRAAAALLELFEARLVDRYVETTLNLEHCFVFATAQRLDRVASILRERIEPIPLFGFDRAQKIEIVRDHLLPHALRATGLQETDLQLEPAAIELLVNRYDQEPGVHGLRRALMVLLRRVGAAMALGERRRTPISSEQLEMLLGPPPFDLSPVDPHRRPEVGVAAGLTYNADRSELALVEALRSGSERPLTATSDHDPNVRTEAIASALAFIRHNARELRAEPEALGPDIHVRAVCPSELKPNARYGLDLAVLLALASLASDRPIRPDVAAVGRLSLRGGVHPLDGIPDMVLAAGRRGIGTILVPRAAISTLERALSPSTLQQLRIVAVASAVEAVRASLIDVVIARNIDPNAS